MKKCCRYFGRIRLYRLVVLFLLIGQSSIYARSFGQEQTVSLHKNDILLINLLEEIEMQTEYTFVYKSEDVSKISLNVNADNQKVEDLLKTYLAGTGLDFEFEDKLIILRKEVKKVMNNQTVKAIFV